MRRCRPGRAAPAFLLLLLLSVDAAGAGLTAAQERGKRIYMEGKGRKRITAFLPEAGITAPGRGFPCVNCHLAGGVGQLEGGIQSADITWFTLTKEYSGARPTGRTHPPYTDETLRNAITDGVDPAGNTLASAHPLFRMDREDLDDLLAYMKVMDQEPVPGVTDNQIRIGMLVPAAGPLAEASREIETLLSSYGAAVNARGGVYNRFLRLVPLPYDPVRAGSATAAVKAAEEKGEVFCYLANVGIDANDDAARYLSGEKVPVIVPLLSSPESGYGTDRYTFHIFASVRDQARVMVDFLADRPSSPAIRPGLLYPRDRSGEGGAAGAREQAKKRGVGPWVEIPYDPGTFDPGGSARRLKDAGVGAVLFFGGAPEALAFSRAAADSDWSPLFLAPAPMVGSGLLSAPGAFLDRVYLTSPLTVPDPGSARMKDFLELRSRAALGDRHGSFQFLAYAGAVLLEEGLKRSGRALTREKLVAALGNVWKLETGVAPPLTYNANRRSGAVGSAILRLDRGTGRFVTVAEWQEPK
ncbi:MAG TPA: ABC transporter substrate-binding protein [Candidatus Deferrimicrobiaceae bacterium]